MCIPPETCCFGTARKVFSQPEAEAEPTQVMGVMRKVDQSSYGPHEDARAVAGPKEPSDMDSIIYLVGLIVVVMFILSALGLR
jgi:hypothetical protein